MFGQHNFAAHAGDFGGDEGSFSTLSGCFTPPVKGKLLGSGDGQAFTAIQSATQSAALR